jgi:hypothetical protein
MLSILPRWLRPKPEPKPDIPRWTIAELVEQRRRDEAEAGAHSVQHRFNEERKKRDATAIRKWILSYVATPGQREETKP